MAIKALRSVKGPDYVAAKLLRVDRWANAKLSRNLPKTDIVNRNDRCAITFIAHDMGGIVVRNVDPSIRIFSRGNTDGMDNYSPDYGGRKQWPLCPCSTTRFDWRAPNSSHTLDQPSINLTLQLSYFSAVPIEPRIVVVGVPRL